MSSEKIAGMSPVNGALVIRINSGVRKVRN